MGGRRCVEGRHFFRVSRALGEGMRDAPAQRKTSDRCERALSFFVQFSPEWKFGAAWTLHLVVLLVRSSA